MSFYNIFNKTVDSKNLLLDAKISEEEFNKSNTTSPSSYDYVNDNFLKFEPQSLLKDDENVLKEDSIKLDVELPINDEPIDHLKQAAYMAKDKRDLLNLSVDEPHAAYHYDVRTNFTTIKLENNTFIFANNKTTRFSNRDFFHVAVYTFLSVLVFYLFIICIMRTMKLLRKNRSRRKENLNFEMVDLTEDKK